MHCLFCQTEVGHDVLTIWGEAICSDCEAYLVELSAEKPNYEQAIRIFRYLWQKHYFYDQSRHLPESEPL
ncbi:MAG TPA: hypothetical protein GX528_01590 [Firmicutes bacterium]|nr:hypothetical protein [Bacillota bacterium]